MSAHLLFRFNLMGLNAIRAGDNAAAYEFLTRAWTIAARTPSLPQKVEALTLFHLGCLEHWRGADDTALQYVMGAIVRGMDCVHVQMTLAAILTNMGNVVEGERIARVAADDVWKCIEERRETCREDTPHYIPGSMTAMLCLTYLTIAICQQHSGVDPNVVAQSFKTTITSTRRYVGEHHPLHMQAVNSFKQFSRHHGGWTAVSSSFPSVATLPPIPAPGSLQAASLLMSASVVTTEDLALVNRLMLGRDTFIPKPPPSTGNGSGSTYRRAADTLTGSPTHVEDAESAVPVPPEMPTSVVMRPLSAADGLGLATAPATAAIVSTIERQDGATSTLKVYRGHTNLSSVQHSHPQTASPPDRVPRQHPSSSGKHGSPKLSSRSTKPHIPISTENDPDGAWQKLMDTLDNEKRMEWLSEIGLNPSLALTVHIKQPPKLPDQVELEKLQTQQVRLQQIRDQYIETERAIELQRLADEVGWLKATADSSVVHE